jgi:hypothetical protein
MPRPPWLESRVTLHPFLLVIGRFDNARTDRVAVDISGQFDGVSIGLYQDRFEPLLKQVPRQPPALNIEVGSIGSIEVLHDMGKITARSFQQ